MTMLTFLATALKARACSARLPRDLPVRLFLGLLLALVVEPRTPHDAPVLLAIHRTAVNQLLQTAADDGKRVAAGGT
eukprot:109721-Hanusia_phi.AAC.7